MLRGKGDHRRRPAERGRHGAGIEIVRAHHAHAGLLLDVAVAVDAARQHELAGRIDLACGCALHIGAKCRHLAVLDGDVAFALAFGGDDPGVTDDQIVVGHYLFSLHGDSSYTITVIPSVARDL